MMYGAFWRRAAWVAVFSLVVGCLSCGMTATSHSRDLGVSRPEVFGEVTRVVESSFWDVNKLSPQTLLKGAFEGVDDDLRRQGGAFDYKGEQVLVSLNGQSRLIDLSTIDSFSTMIQAFGDIHGFFLQHQRLNGQSTNWEYRAIEGMVKSLDGNSAFMPPHEFREMQEETRGSFGGIGIRIGVEDGQIIVVEPMEGTPAPKRGFNRAIGLPASMANPPKE